MLLIWNMFAVADFRFAVRLGSKVLVKDVGLVEHGQVGSDLRCSLEPGGQSMTWHC